MGVSERYETTRVSDPGPQSGVDDMLSARRLTLSIVIPNYNHAQYLPRCLGSVAAQTRLPDEVLVIDDASTDNSVDIISACARDISGFSLVRHNQNCGVVTRLNEGLERARGTYVLFLAADDWIEPEFVAVTMSLLEQYPDAGLCSGLCRLAGPSDELLRPFPTPLPLSRAGFILPDQTERVLVYDDGWFNGNTTVVRRKAALEAGGYRKELLSFTDKFLNTTLALRYGACFIPRYLAVWRRLDTGYAAAVNSDPGRMLAVLPVAKALMTEQAIFKPDYIARWETRWRYTAAVGCLNGPPTERSRWLSQVLPHAMQWLAPWLDRIRRLPFVGRRLATVMLFALLRWRDLGAVLRRRAGWIVWRRRLERTLS